MKKIIDLFYLKPIIYKFLFFISTILSELYYSLGYLFIIIIAFIYFLIDLNYIKNKYNTTILINKLVVMFFLVTMTNVIMKILNLDKIFIASHSLPEIIGTIIIFIIAVLLRKENHKNLN